MSMNILVILFLIITYLMIMMYCLGTYPWVGVGLYLGMLWFIGYMNYRNDKLSKK